MSAGCCSLLYNDVLVVKGNKLTFRFATFFVLISIAATVERYTTTVSVHKFPRKIRPVVHFYTLHFYYYFQQIYKDNLHNPRMALANLGGY